MQLLCANHMLVFCAQYTFILFYIGDRFRNIPSTVAKDCLYVFTCVNQLQGENLNSYVNFSKEKGYTFAPSGILK